MEAVREALTSCRLSHDNDKLAVWINPKLDSTSTSERLQSSLGYLLYKYSAG